MTGPNTRLGRPVWVDLSTSDPAAARAFYATLFGWDIQVAEEPEFGGYGSATVDGKDVAGGYGSATVDGKDVAGIGSAQPGAPTAWSLYLLTDDAAALGERVAAAGDLHALVNNAGGALGLDPIEAADLDQWRQMFELNVVGTMRVTQALLPALRESGRGDVVVVTSTAAHEPYPGGAGYVAAKYAERIATRTLRLELVGEPIRVIEIAPGMVHTEEFSLNRFGGAAERAAAVYRGVPGALVAEDIADAIVWALTRPHHVNIDTMIIRPRAQASNTKIARTGV